MIEEIEERNYKLAEAWKLIEACPNYYHDEEEGPQKYINMNDVWGWAYSVAIVLTDENVVRIAELYDNYGFAGLLYFQVESGEFFHSEFEDNNRRIQFVANEERILKEQPSSNNRAYYKTSYQIDGNIRKWICACGDVYPIGEGKDDPSHKKCGNCMAGTPSQFGGGTSIEDCHD